MSTDKKTAASQTRLSKLEGIQLAIVIGHNDPTFGGRLQVTLTRDQGNLLGEQPYNVRPMFPFFGNTAYEHQGLNQEDFNDTQKTYGMWFVPPDVGTTVMVVFIDADPAQGYWIGCVPPRFAHRMVPAIGADTNYSISDEDKEKYATKGPLPVAEINRRLNGQTTQEINEDRIAKAVHPAAETYLTQGTLEDYIRGPLTTTSRREPPNSVYGISTPGPLDRRPGAKRSKLGTRDDQTFTSVPVSRLGGTTFVMDDGDDRYQRIKTASEAGIGEPLSEENGAYADTQADEAGIPTIPYGECFRIRTRTGHQLLLHNSEDLIYITNARGTAWVELTSDGKIDVYAEDSISVHSQNDVNIYADRDINMEAGRNINMKASAEYSKTEPTDEKGLIQDSKEFESGRIQMESAFNTNLLVGANLKIETRKYIDENDEEVDGNLDINIKGNTRLAVGEGDVEESYVLDIRTDGTTSMYNTIDFNLLSDQNNKFTALSGATDILSGGNHTETAARIDMNGPQAAEAPEATLAETITDLPLHSNLVTDGTKVWADSKYLEDYALNSIMKRIPMHEPWAQHENVIPTLVKPDQTDRES